MGLDASVRCRCFEEGKLRPAPVPPEDLYIDEDGYLSSRMLDKAYRRYGFKQYYERYKELDDAFRRWSDFPCEHEFGEICNERVGNWSGVGMFRHYCYEIGEERLPVLFHIIPSGNGGTFPASMAKAALEELDYFDEWLDREMEANPTGTLLDVSTNEELWSREDGKMEIDTGISSEAEISEGIFRLVGTGEHVGEILFSASEFSHRFIDGPEIDKEQRRYELFSSDGCQHVECRKGFGFCKNEETSFKIGSRKAWCWTFAHESLRILLNASLETGNPIRWC